MRIIICKKCFYNYYFQMDENGQSVMTMLSTCQVRLAQKKSDLSLAKNAFDQFAPVAETSLQTVADQLS